MWPLIHKMMKYLALITIALLSYATDYASEMERTFWGCELGVTTKEQAVDTIKAQLAKQFTKPQIDGEELVANNIWLYGYQFDTAKLVFENDKLKSINLIKECFDLSMSDQFMREFSKKLLGEEGEYSNNEGILTKRDSNTYIRMAQTEGETRQGVVEIMIINLK